MSKTPLELMELHREQQTTVDKSLRSGLVATIIRRIDEAMETPGQQFETKAEHSRLFISIRCDSSPGPSLSRAERQAIVDHYIATNWGDIDLTISAENEGGLGAVARTVHSVIGYFYVTDRQAFSRAFNYETNPQKYRRPWWKFWK